MSGLCCPLIKGCDELWLRTRGHYARFCRSSNHRQRSFRVQEILSDEDEEDYHVIINVVLGRRRSGLYIDVVLFQQEVDFVVDTRLHVSSISDSLFKTLISSSGRTLTWFNHPLPF